MFTHKTIPYSPYDPELLPACTISPGNLPGYFDQPSTSGNSNETNGMCFGNIPFLTYDI